MFIEARCPRCGRDYKLATHLRGKTVTCKECRAAFPVADSRAGIQPGPAVPVLTPAEGPPQAQEQRPRIYDEGVDILSRRPLWKSDGEVVLRRLALLCGLSLLMAVVAAGAFSFMGSMRTAGMPAPVPASPPAFADNEPPLPNWPEPREPPGPGPILVPVPMEPPPADPAFPHPLPELPLPPHLAPERVAWKGQPDPGPDVLRRTIKPGTPVPLPGHAEVVFPTALSRFVAVRYGPLVLPTWEVIDLERFESVAAFTRNLDLHDPVLSPDGKWLAGKGTPAFATDPVRIVSVADKRVVRTILLESRAAFLHRIDFLDNDRLLTLKTQGLASICEVFDVGSGRRRVQFSIPDLLVRPRNSLALSAGGRYLAVAHDSWVDLYDTGDGQLVGRLTLPGEPALVEGLAFSADGKELACLWQELGELSQLISWKMATGRAAVRHSFARDTKDLVPSAFAYTGAVVQWAPDGNSWLLYGAAWIDHDSGALLSQVPDDPGDLRGFPRRLFGKHQLVLARPNGADYQLTVISLPRARCAGGGPSR